MIPVRAANHVPFLFVREDDLLWYVAYGSNLSRERFVTYLTGAPQ